MMPGWLAVLIAVSTAWFCLKVLGDRRGVVLFLVVLAVLMFVQGGGYDPDCVDYGHAARVC